MKRRISITVSEELLESFRSYCRANGMKLSSKIEIMLRNALKDVKEKPPEKVK